MKILTINAGSFSLRLEYFTGDAAGRLNSLHKQDYVSSGAADPESLRDFIDKYGIDGTDIIAHRIVHGGPNLSGTCLITRQVQEEIEKAAQLAPLHNPAALAWVKVVSAVMGNTVSQVAVFDTAYFRALPAVAAVYPLPAALCDKHGIHRFGFHGIAHHAMWAGWTDARADLPAGGRLITLQLGGGCSISAVANGKVMDTSMGFSPLEGLMMGTRCGDIDPGIITFLLRDGQYSLADLERILNHESGLAGVSGIGSDMRELLQSKQPRARFAVKLFCYRVRKYLGAYMAVLGGLDGIVFGGGIGEHTPAVREMILKGMSTFGIDLDPVRNSSMDAAETIPARISPDHSPVDVRVMAVNEARQIAREALHFVSQDRRQLAGG